MIEIQKSLRIACDADDCPVDIIVPVVQNLQEIFAQLLIAGWKFDTDTLMVKSELLCPFCVKKTQLNELLEKEGYKNVRYVQGVGWCGLMPMLFTTGVFLDLDEIGPAQGRYCFNEWAEAAYFLENWDGITEPVAGLNGCTANKRIRG